MRRAEQRQYPLGRLEIRAMDGSGPIIAGHAAVFDSLSHDFGGWRERIAPGAFKRSLKSGGVVKSYFNHDPAYVLGRTDNRTLTVAEDLEGLAYQVSPPDTQWARDLAVSMERGDITDASFAFRTIRDSWETTAEGEQVRTLLEVQLYELGPVSDGAYPEADSAVRSFLTARGVNLTELRAVPSTFADALELIERSDPPEPGHSDLDVQHQHYRYRLELVGRRA